MKLRIGTALLVAVTAGLGWAQRTVTFPLGNGVAQVRGDLYGRGTRGLVLAHGGRFDEKSWKKQAEVFAQHGFVVLAVRYRGDRLNSDGSPSAEGSYPDNAADVLAAAEYLRRKGAKTVDAIGASLGGDAVGNADAMSATGMFARMIFLGSEGGDAPEKLSGRKLFLVARDDRSGDGPRLPGIETHYARAPEPKKLLIVGGSAHAQYLFDTNQGPRVMKEILEFLEGR
jgi:dienelactone hydrolase